MTTSRRDPVIVFGVVLASLASAVYLAAAFTDPPNKGFATVLACVPVVTAGIAWAVTRQPIRWGRPSKWLLLSIAFPLAVGLSYGLAAGVGQLDYIGAPNPANLIVSGVVLGLIFLIEEAGWRGYLLPYLRDRYSFWKANGILVTAWWLFHAPIVVIGGGQIYGSPGQPLVQQLGFFTLAIVSFSLIVGVIWERNNDVWGATIAHGVWNFSVQTGWEDSFTGPQWLTGEFGLLPGLTMVVLAVVLVPLLTRRTAPRRRHGPSSIAS